MEGLKEAVFAMNIKAEVDSMKRREIALLYALQSMEKERIKMLSLLYDANRCQDCIRLPDCKQRSRKWVDSTYKAKIRNPETFCTMWDYGGEYTPLNELLTIARMKRKEEETAKINMDNKKITEEVLKALDSKRV